MLRIFIAFALMTAPTVALAAGEMAVVSEMFVEKTMPAPGGKTKTVLVVAKSGPPGTRLVFTHSYRNTTRTPLPNFGMTNPMPAGVEYLGSDDANAIVSVDGGKSWGALAALKVPGAAGVLRPARPEDVTHVRWKLAVPVPPGGTGKFSFRGIVK